MCKRTSVVQIHISTPLVFLYIMMHSCVYSTVVTFNFPIFLELIGCCGKAFYRKEKARCRKAFAHKWGPLLPSKYEGIPFDRTQIFKNMVTISDELILAVESTRV